MQARMSKQLMLLVCFMSVARLCRALTSHSLITLPTSPLATVLPSAENAMAVIHSSCSLNVAYLERFSAFHNWTVLSSPPLAIIFPSGENANARSLSSCGGSFIPT